MFIQFWLREEDHKILTSCTPHFRLSDVRTLTMGNVRAGRLNACSTLQSTRMIDECVLHGTIKLVRTPNYLPLHLRNNDSAAFTFCARVLVQSLRAVHTLVTEEERLKGDSLTQSYQLWLRKLATLIFFTRCNCDGVLIRLQPPHWQ